MMYMLLFCLFTKHFLCDFLLQTPYIYRNKGNLRHAGGYIHAGLHAFVTLLIVLHVVYWPIALLIALAEFVAHYGIDYLKEFVVKRDAITPSDARWFYLLGLDQYLHYLTYWLIFYYALSYTVKSWV